MNDFFSTFAVSICLEMKVTVQIFLNFLAKAAFLHTLAVASSIKPLKNDVYANIINSSLF